MRVKRPILMSLAAACFSLALAQPADTQSNAEGYATRSKLMLQGNNYLGTIHQSDEATRIDDECLDEQMLMTRANALFEKNDPECLELFAQLAREHRESPLANEAQARIADFAFYHRDYDRAFKEYSAIRLNALDDDKAEDVEYRKAYCLMMLDRRNHAAGIYRQLHKTKRYGKAAAFFEAYIDYADGNYIDARQKFEAIPSGGELGYQSQYYLCQIYYKQGEYDHSLDLATTLLEEGSNDYFDCELHRIAGESAFRLHKKETARKQLSEYLISCESYEDITPERSAYYMLGVLDYNDGKYRSCADHLSVPDVTAEDDEMAQSAYMYLGQCFLKLGELNRASRAFERAASMRHDSATREAALYNYAITQSKGARTPFGKSIDLFEQFLNEYPNSKRAPEVENYLSDAYITTGDYDRALKSISHISNPSDKVLRAKQYVLYKQGRQTLESGNPTLGEKQLREALEMGDKDKEVAAECRFWLAKAQYEQGKYDEAEGNLKKYLSATDKNSDNFAIANYELGATLFQQEKYKDAEKAFKAAIDNGKLSRELKADAYNRLADAQYYNQKLAEAEVSYTQAATLSEQGKADYPLYQKSLIAGHKEDYESQVQQLNSLLDAYPQSIYAPVAMFDKANALDALGKNDEATSVRQELVAKYPKTDEARKAVLQVALAQRDAGHTDAAVASYKRVIESYPSSTEAQTAAEDLKQIYASRGELAQLSEYLNGVPNGPRLDISEMEKLDFEAAQNYAIEHGDVTKLNNYLNNYPNGAYTSAAKYYVARNYYAEDRYEEALELLDEALDRYSDAEFAEDALAIKSDILLKQDKASEAVECYEDLAAKASSNDTRITAEKGIMRAAIQAQQWEDVLDAADVLLDMQGLSNTEEEEARLGRALAAAQLGRYSVAKDDLNKLTENINTPAGAQAAYELGKLHFDNGNLDEAQRVLENNIDRGTEQKYWLAKCFIMLADVYNAQGETNEAIDLLRSLKANYTGSEGEIYNDIDTRIGSWKNKK